MRFLVVAVLSVLLAQESSLGSILAGAECPETCPDDSPAGRCSPVCVTCSCGTHLNPVPQGTVRLATPPTGDAFVDASPALARADGHPSDISHVPIYLLS